jgi:hypothetical protein
VDAFGIVAAVDLVEMLMTGVLDAWSRSTNWPAGSPGTKTRRVAAQGPRGSSLERGGTVL